MKTSFICRRKNRSLLRSHSHWLQWTLASQFYLVSYSRLMTVQFRRHSRTHTHVDMPTHTHENLFLVSIESINYYCNGRNKYGISDGLMWATLSTRHDVCALFKHIKFAPRKNKVVAFRRFFFHIFRQNTNSATQFHESAALPLDLFRYVKRCASAVRGREKASEKQTKKLFASLTWALHCARNSRQARNDIVATSVQFSCNKYEMIQMQFGRCVCVPVCMQSVSFNQRHRFHYFHLLQNKILHFVLPFRLKVGARDVAIMSDISTTQNAFESTRF